MIHGHGVINMNFRENYKIMKSVDFCEEESDVHMIQTIPKLLWTITYGVKLTLLQQCHQFRIQ